MSASSIAFDVSYGLLEYLSICRENALPYYNEERRKKGKPEVTANNWPLRISLALFVPPIFFYKVARVGQCNFSINEIGITRVAKDGTLSCAWGDVVAVKRLERAYLVMKTDGAMPLPYRCFTREQLTKFEEMLTHLGK